MTGPLRRVGGVRTAPARAHPFRRRFFAPSQPHFRVVVNNFHSGDGNHSAKNPPLAATLVCWQATLVHQGGKQPGDPARGSNGPRRRSPSATYGSSFPAAPFPRSGLAGPLERRVGL